MKNYIMIMPTEDDLTIVTQGEAEEVTLEFLQKAVGGYIELCTHIVLPGFKNLVCYCNEEGMFDPKCLPIYFENPVYGEFSLRGNLIITGDDYHDMTDEEANEVMSYLSRTIK